MSLTPSGPPLRLIEVTSLLVSTLLLVGVPQTPLSSFTPATGKAGYVGRFTSEPQPRCAWPLSTIVLQGVFDDLEVELEAETANDRWQIEVDGTVSGVVKLVQGRKRYSIVRSPSKKVRTVRLVRRTEAMSKPTRFVAIYANKGARFQSPKLGSKRLLVVGDSISAGFGVDGKNQNEPYSFETANAYMTYGAIASRRLGIECTDIAWSGKKMWPDNTMPEIFDFILPEDRSTQLKPGQEKPFDAIVINLGTNDFGKTNPEEAGWKAGYTAFYKKVRKANPSAHIYFAVGSMMSDNWPPQNKALSTIRRYIASMIDANASDKKLHYLEFETQNVERDGSGSAWHPNQTTQKNMADRLVTALKRDLRL